MSGDSTAFYDSVTVFDGFRSLMDPALYTALPDDWSVGLSDVVDSTGAIAQNRYKAVNMAGAAVIAAVTNALGGREFPFVFGGDGASFAVSPQDQGIAREALAATARWVADDLGLTMRVAMVTMAEVRSHGMDIRVARFAPSPNVTYAMFAGGGLGWAEAQMKQGAFAIAPAAEGAMPDLTGLSCRFEEIRSKRGIILSVLVVPTPSGDMSRFRALIEDVIALVERSPEAGRPVPAEGPPLRWPPKGMEFEARTSRDGSPVSRRLKLLGFTFFAYLVMRFKIDINGFVAKRYIRQVVENSDFRKYDDGLRMVLDCTPDLEATLRRRLETAAANGTARMAATPRPRAH